ncbi:MAG: DNA-binding protein [Crenarchaeota archaeon]|jgi:hypothetical protein|nr:DNA-binding protein [Thermoproteota archaeon]
MNYLTPTQFGKKLLPPVTGRRVKQLCNEGRITGAIRIGGRNWAIPENATCSRKLKHRKKG